jgi:hypothetical protein
MTSHSRLYSSSRIKSLCLQVTQRVIQDVLFHECDALVEWFYRLHFYIVRLGYQIIWKCVFQGYDRPLQGLWATPETRGTRRGVASRREGGYSWLADDLKTPHFSQLTLVTPRLPTLRPFIPAHRQAGRPLLYKTITHTAGFSCRNF